VAVELSLCAALGWFAIFCACCASPPIHDARPLRSARPSNDMYWSQATV
jgi:hypothetical protein